LKTTVEKEFLGNRFIYSTDVDESTGKSLWSKEIDMQFSKWIYDLKNADRELFKVQYSISFNAYGVLNRLKELIGVYDDSLLVRAITITFINYVDTRRGKGILKRLGDYKKSSDLEVLKEGKILKKNLYFSPNGMRDVEAYSGLTGLKKSVVVQSALYTVLLISINEDMEIQKFWENVILGQLTTIAKAA
jgi:hypothetical protein